MEQEAFEPIGYAVTHPLPFNNASKANAAATNNREEEEEAHKQENIEQAETNLCEAKYAPIRLQVYSS